MGLSPPNEHGADHRPGSPDPIDFVKVISASGASQILPELKDYTGVDITLSATCANTMPTPVKNGYYTATIRQAVSGGPYGCTFTGVKWPGGIAPIMSSGNGATDIYQFMSDGAYWYGVIAGQAFS